MPLYADLPPWPPSDPPKLSERAERLVAIAERYADRRVQAELERAGVRDDEGDAS